MDELFNTPDFILENQNEIEKNIEYHFGSQTKLLIQAFTRKTFAKENEGFVDNEVLELYGDQLVNTIITKILFETYSKIPSNYQNEYFISSKNEAELSKLRASYINKSALAHCIEILGFDDYLLVGKSDEEKEIWKNEKVRCDLFEAIIGAIAVSSAKHFSKDIIDWDFVQIEKSCRKMWSALDFQENYESNLFDACDDLGLNPPVFQPKYYLGMASQKYDYRVTLYNSKNQRLNEFEGAGSSEMAAKFDAAKKAINYLHSFEVNSYLENATPDTAVQTLNTLYLKQLITKPIYEFESYDDGEGCQVWNCSCAVDNYADKEDYENRGYADKHSKAEAKQAAAYDMICFILDKPNTTRTWICPECGYENTYDAVVCQMCYEYTRED